MNIFFMKKNKLANLTHWSMIGGIIAVTIFHTLIPVNSLASPLEDTQQSKPRRVNAPYLTSQPSGEVDWTQSAIFWFGINEQGIPSKNYVDIRAAYTMEGLRIHAMVVDYYLWLDKNPTPTTDLTQWDAIAIYLDTQKDGATSPQTDDYYFLLGAHHNTIEDPAKFNRQARGTGSGWNTGWNGNWSFQSLMEWGCEPGRNSNVCGIDYGWMGTFVIPWDTLGLSGVPSQGTVWGLGVQLYDRDDNPPAGYVDPEYWPETFNTDNPASWAELHFGYANYNPPFAQITGSTIIRAASVSDSTVEDSWMGGGGTCSSGHNGGSEINHGDSTDLYIGNEIRPTHFPCFNKSFLRFQLGSVPAGKTIISAELTLHLWGNAGLPAEPAQPSWVHLFTISDPWEEMTIHWNNAPLAQENTAASWVNPYSLEDIVWPGDPYTWDATQAVAEAYAHGQPLSIALYSSDKDQHSSKYLKASETGDWNYLARPTLEIIWGDASPPCEDCPKVFLPINSK